MPTVTFTTVGEDIWQVHEGVTSIDFIVAGGSGGNSGGTGGCGNTVRGTVPVTPGEELIIFVAGAGESAMGQVGGNGGIGGDEGGPGGSSNQFGASGGGGGGGASSITRDPPMTILVRAGGGGGAGGSNAAHGGDAFKPGFPQDGEDGTNAGNATGGSGATTLAVGSGGANSGDPGVFSFGGAGADSANNNAGGGGGGGEFGGGGGGEDQNGAGGGGGSSRVDVSVTNAQFGTCNVGNGFISITFRLPSSIPVYRNIVQRTSCELTPIYYRVPGAEPPSGSCFKLGTTVVTYPYFANGGKFTGSFKVILLPPTGC